MHHDGDKCKYEVFNNGQFIASFEPGGHKILHICKDAGVMDEVLLYLVADELERYNI
jgi:hypothetical protein